MLSPQQSLIKRAPYLPCNVNSGRASQMKSQLGRARVPSGPTPSSALEHAKRASRRPNCDQEDHKEEACSMALDPREAVRILNET